MPLNNLHLQKWCVDQMVCGFFHVLYFLNKINVDLRTTPSSHNYVVNILILCNIFRPY